MRMKKEIPSRFEGLKKKLESFKIPARMIFIVLGIASTVWFLIRVIPKPQRAGYPCMRAAAPVMSGFFIWLLGFTGAFAAFRKSRMLFARSRYLLASVFVLAGLAISGFLVYRNADSTFAGTTAAPDVEPVHPENTPMGVGQGIHPGRVVWAHDIDATNENLDPSSETPYQAIENNDQSVVLTMVDNIVLKLTGATNTTEAWDKMFHYFNNKKGKGEIGYSSDETIFIKINEGTSSWAANDNLEFHNWYDNPSSETTPVTTYAILYHLVNYAGVPQEKIWVADPQSHVWQHTYELCSADFPNVKYGDNDPANEALGRTTIHKSNNMIMQFSDQGTVMTEAVEDSYYEEMENADYLINLAALKAHARAGITLTAKNHFGSQNRGGAGHMHAGLIAPENDLVEREDYGMYRVQVDLMGHEKIGGNTLLFLVDGLWGGPEAVAEPVKWQMEPFNNDWPNSIFASLDQVALESVCFDFLRSEAKVNSAFNNRPNFAQGVDDYLHQAASSINWPDGITYDPEGDGTAIESLGVHEHWNSTDKKQYSRNLGNDFGIELVTYPESLVKTMDPTYEVSKIPDFGANSPTWDAVADDDVWSNVFWQGIDQLWINKDSETPGASDFYGRYKLAWSSTENMIYVIAETEDDSYVDGYTCGDGGYPDYDILEIFLDPDKSGGAHLMDGSGSVWGYPRGNGENAFSYHIAINFPENGQATTDYCVMDLGGTASDNNPVKVQYTDHLEHFIARRVDNKIIWEFAIKVYDDTYTDADPASSRKTLTADDVLGLAVAYCDADDAVGRDHFFGSDECELVDGQYNDHWWNADKFGEYTLIAENQTNAGPVVITDITDYKIPERNIEKTVISDLYQYFNDPNEDPLTFSANCDDANVTIDASNDALKITVNDQFTGPAQVEIAASDNSESATMTFLLKVNNTPHVENDLTTVNIYTEGAFEDIIDDLYTVFADPDGDELTFQASSNADGTSLRIINKSTLQMYISSDFPGTGEVTVTANDGEYTVEETFNVDLTTNITDYDVSSSITVFPNPMTGNKLNIELPETMINAGDVRFVIYSSNGQVIQTLEKQIVEQPVYSLELYNMPQGIYYLEVRSDRYHGTKILRR